MDQSLADESGVQSAVLDETARVDDEHGEVRSRLRDDVTEGNLPSTSSYLHEEEAEPAGGDANESQDLFDQQSDNSGTGEGNQDEEESEVEADASATIPKPRFKIPKRYCQFVTSQKLVLPEAGVFNEKGYLFHHVIPATLKPEHYERLKEFGIRVEKGVMYSAEEDERIRRNWRQFADEHGMHYEDAIHYIGFSTQKRFDRKTVLRVKRDNDMLVRLGMWPKICRKLEHRSASSVHRRMLVIMDPHFTGIAEPITPEESLEAFRLLDSGVSVFDISWALRRPMARVEQNLYQLEKTWLRAGHTIEDVINDPELLECRKLHIRHYRRLFRRVLRDSGINEPWLRDQLASQRSYAAVTSRLSDFNWTRLLPIFSMYNEKNIKRGWTALMDFLLSEFLSQLTERAIDSPDDVDVHVAWLDATKKVMPFVDCSPLIIAGYLKSLRKCIGKDSQARLLNCLDVDQAKFRAKLIRRGIIEDDDSWKLADCTYFRRLAERLKHKEDKILLQLRVTLSIRDKLRLLENCYRRIARDSVREDQEFLKFPSISRTVLIECLIELMIGIDPDWRPPRLFQQWIKTPRFIDLYSKHSDNSEIYNPVRATNLFRKTFFSDKSCLRGLKFSNGAAMGLWNALQKASGGMTARVRDSTVPSPPTGRVVEREQQEEVQAAELPRDTSTAEEEEIDDARMEKRRKKEKRREEKRRRRKLAGWDMDRDGGTADGWDILERNQGDQRDTRDAPITSPIPPVDDVIGDETNGVDTWEGMPVPRRKEKSRKRGEDRMLEIESPPPPADGPSSALAMFDETIMAGMDMTQPHRAARLNDVNTPRVDPSLSPVLRAKRPRLAPSSSFSPPPPTTLPVKASYTKAARSAASPTSSQPSSTRGEADEVDAEDDPFRHLRVPGVSSLPLSRPRRAHSPPKSADAQDFLSIFG